MSAKAVKALSGDPTSGRVAKEDGLTREEFQAVNGLAPLPREVAVSSRPVVVYEQAVRAIRACRTIDEAKYWNDTAEALSAWARIYTDDRIMREARALKLHAYRRIGQLADAMRIAMPQGSGYGGIKGKTPGSRSLLLEHGIRSTNAQYMITIGRMNQAAFDEATGREKPPSPSVLCSRELRSNPLWAEVGNKISMLLCSAKRVTPKHLAASLDKKQRQKARRMVAQAQRWLDAFRDEIER